MMRAALLLGALSVAACHATSGDGAQPARESAAATPGPGAGGLVVRLHLAQGARRRVFVPGASLTHVDPATDAPVSAPTTPPPGDASTGPDMAFVVPGPGHYTVHFLVARCAPDSPDGGCNKEGPKPDDLDFDVPPSGNLDINVR